MSVYNENAFSERVNLAAAYIAAGRSTTRTFDTCFEMHVRRDAEALAHVPTRDLPRAAAEIRAKAREEFEAFMARRYG